MSADRLSFENTHWSLVLAAGHKSSPDSQAALAELCRRYWYPLYAYIRRRTQNPEESQDLTQEFFTQLLEKNVLAVVQPEHGKFRAFLLTACKHFLSKERDRARAQKRGGGESPLTLDFPSGEVRYSLEPRDDWTPERLYDRQWAMTLLEQVLDRLREEWTAAGKKEHFEHLSQCLVGQSSTKTYAEIGADLGLSEAAARMAAHRLRQRYRELLRAEIAQTVAGPEEVEEEIQNLFASFAS